MNITITGYVTLLKTGVAKKTGNAYCIYNIVGQDGVGKKFFGGPIDDSKGIDQEALSVIGGSMKLLEVNFELTDDGGLRMTQWEYAL